MILLVAASLAAAPPEPVRLRIVVDGKVGFADGTGAVAVPARFDEAGDFAEGRFPFETGVVVTGDLHDHTKATWGYADASGAVVVPPRWLAAYPYSQGRAQVKCPDGHWAYLDPAGALAVPCTLWRTTPYADGRALVELSRDHWGVIDPGGKVVFELPPEADLSDPDTYAEGLLAVDVGKATRYYDRDGKVAFEVPGWGRAFSDGLAPFRSPAGTWGYLAKDGSVAIAPTFERAGPFHDGVATYDVNGRTGLIGKDGNVLVPARFQRLWFEDGLGFASLDGVRFGYVDRTGAWVIPPTLGDPEDARSTFHGGFAFARLADGRTGWIDRSGKVVWPR